MTPPRPTAAAGPPITFKRGVRGSIPLLLGFAGGTGSGKTYTALRVARGIAGDHPFAVIDTENDRALHYADEFEFEHGGLEAPFSPSRYLDAIFAARKHLEAVPRDRRVVVVDSASHEHEGEGGLLDIQAAEFDRLGGRDAVKLLSWVKPKQEHKRFVTRLLQLDAHVILCFRAEEKGELVDGKWVAKKSLTGLDGWIPIAEKRLPFELTASWLLVADNPGVGRPIKLPRKLAAVWPNPTGQITEELGARLQEWAAEGSGRNSAPAARSGQETRTQPAAGREATPTDTERKTALTGAETAEAITTAQARTLNRLVEKLSTAGTIELSHVFRVVAKTRGVEPRELPGVTAGGLEWGPLLETLTKPEAGELIERLVALETPTGGGE